MNREELEAGLRKLGLTGGDIVLLHSSLSSVGKVDGGADTVIDAFLSILGSEGTLVVPTFGALGVIPETLKKRADAVSSIHPRASVASIGRKAIEICSDHWKAETAHSHQTPYTRIADLGGYVCLLGVDHDRNTTLHTVEALLELPYLNRTPEVTFSTPVGEITKSWPHFPGPHRNFIGLERLLQEEGIIRHGKIGEAVVRLMKSRELIDKLLTTGTIDPDFVLCDNPNCEDCLHQRAAINRHRFAREDFVIAASGLLAGRYVPQMVESCKSQGIDAIELDYIQGEPVQLIPRERLSAAVSELKEGGCAVVALRASSISEYAPSLIETAAECAVPRVVFPLTKEATDLIPLAAEQNISLSFYNTCLGSVNVFERLSALAETRQKVNLTFCAANFAGAGEKPFLTSYNSKLKRFTDQLDLEDCTFDGTPARLGRGNAEIKELISILRCSSFSGYMVLGAGNRFIGDLRASTDAFLHLLDNM
jgi:aminoglycoside 3-N-acetyltransferase